MKRFIGIITIITVISCGQRERDFHFTSFDQKVCDTIIPVDNWAYTTARLKINGQTNDTIVIEFMNIKRNYIGDFNDDWVLDYYGGKDAPDIIFCFDPLKTTKGDVKVSFGIY